MTRDGEARIANLELELRRALRRLDQVEDAAARALQTATERPPEYGGFLFQALQPAKTGAGGIGAKTAGVAGSATVTLYDIDAGTGAVSSTTTVTAWNYFGSAVGANKDIYLGKFVNDAGVEMWVVPSEAC